MFHRINRSSYFYKIIMSFLLVLMMPSFTMGMVFYYSFENIMKMEIERSSTEILAYITDSIDQRITELNRISVQLQNDPFISMIRHPDTYVDLTIAFKHLSNITTSSSFFSDYFIYFQDIQYIPSYSLIIDKTLFFKYLNISVFNDESKFINYLKKYNEPTIIGPYSSSSILSFPKDKFYLYIYPLSYNFPENDGAAVFVISENTIKQILSRALSSVNGKIQIFDKDLIELIRYGNDSINLSNFITFDMSGNLNYSNKVIEGGKEYLLSSSESKMTKWHFISAVPIEMVNAKLSSVKNRALAAFFLTLVLGIAIIFLLSKVNYKPIKDLIGISTKFAGPPQKANEIQSIKMAFDQMNQTINNYTEKFNSITPSIKRDIIIDLLKGRYCTLEDFNDTASEMNLHLGGDKFTVAVLYVHGMTASNASDIITLAESKGEPDFSIYGTEIPLENYIAFILSCNNNSTSRIFVEFENIKALIKQQLDIDITIGTGNTVSYISQIGVSYLQAKTAVDYRFINGKNTIISFDEVQSDKFTSNHYFYNQLEMLENYLLHNNYHDVEGIFNNIIEEIKTSKLPLFIAKSLSYDISNLLRNSTEKLKIKFPGITHDYLDIFHLSEFETMEELAFYLNKISKEICDHLSVSTVKDERNLIIDLIDYIQHNYADPNFSLNVMAAEFYLSISNLSHYFKTQTGQNISDYIRNLRVEKAKIFLLEDDSNLNIVAAKVGYINVARFIRNFKQCTGVTPGTYRESRNKL